MTNTTINTLGTTYLDKTFYDRQLLESVRTRFVHAKFGQMRPIPRNNGRRVEFRRWNLFDVNDAMQALEEGVTPSGQALSQSNVEAVVSQYGAYVEVSDLLDMTGYDQVIAESAELLGEQLGTVVEWVTRDAINAGNNVQRAGGKSSRAALTSDDKLTVEEIRKAVRTLKRAKARPFCEEERKPHFICICSPDATYDLQNDPLWQDVSKYSNAEQIYSGEIGRLFGVVFVESTEAKVFRQSVHNKVSASTSASPAFLLKNAPSEAEAAYLSKTGNPISIGDGNYTIASFDPDTNTVTLTQSVSLSADAIVYSEDAGMVDATSKTAMDVHATLVFGKDAYGVVDVAGSGALQIIIKPHGSAGTQDPLDQRATVGAKVAAYTAAILNDLWILRIEHAVSA
ncbi:MAG: N4-gp56 family major capsid protein [Clostridia bacterium]|nr:N4-gp56 family major capsid protein [Candidatus Pelethousia sp.]NCB30598.1 N4-gp56 family major capsid protein [Clostridia bacterium]